MVCKICGTELGDDELQCPMCGEPVTSEPEKEEDIVSEEEITESMIESFEELEESKKKGLFSRKQKVIKNEGETEEVSSDKPRKQKFTIRITKKILLIAGAVVLIVVLAIIIALGIHFGLFGTFGKFPKTL